MSVIFNIELVPVIELEPSKFGSTERAINDNRSDHQIWKEALAKSGLSSLEPIQEGSWHVPIEALRDREVLKKLVDILIEIDPDDFAFDYFIALSGGLCPVKGKEILFEPQCCGDLANIEGWKSCVATAGATWEDLWIGHPWAKVRRQNSALEFELVGENVDSGLIAQFSVSIEALEKALAKAEKVQAAFATRLSKVLEAKLEPSVADKLARLLAGVATHYELA